MMPFWIPVALAGAAAVIVVSIDFFVIPRRRAEARRIAAARFRSVFVDAIAQVDKLDAHAFMAEAWARHDAELSDFRRSIESKRLDSFDVAVQKFNRCRTELMPAPAKVLAALQFGRPIDDSDKHRLKDAMSELLLYADGAGASQKSKRDEDRARQTFAL